MSKLSVDAIIAMGAASGYTIDPDLAETLFEIIQQVERPINNVTNVAPHCEAQYDCGQVHVTYRAPTPEMLVETRKQMEDYDHQKDSK